jgi:hypothetical protein
MYQGHGLKDLILHPEELPYIVQIAATTYSTVVPPAPKEADLAFCYNTLSRISKGCVDTALIGVVFPTSTLST